uniref:Uncharacterized protein n=1 Tax=Plectus sambesii TaxID=2011161 RepID=A0A914V7F6_9BILA
MLPSAGIGHGGGFLRRRSGAQCRRCCRAVADVDGCRAQVSYMLIGFLVPSAHDRRRSPADRAASTSAGVARRCLPWRSTNKQTWRRLHARGGARPSHRTNRSGVLARGDERIFYTSETLLVVGLWRGGCGREVGQLRRRLLVRRRLLAAAADRRRCGAAYRCASLRCYQLTSSSETGTASGRRCVAAFITGGRRGARRRDIERGRTAARRSAAADNRRGLPAAASRAPPHKAASNGSARPVTWTARRRAPPLRLLTIDDDMGRKKIQDQKLQHTPSNSSAASLFPNGNSNGANITQSLFNQQLAAQFLNPSAMGYNGATNVPNLRNAGIRSNQEIDFNSQSSFGFTASELLQQAQQQPCEPSTSSNTSPNNVNRTRIPDNLSRNIANQLPLSLQSGNGGDFALNAGDLNALAVAASFNNGSSALTSPWMNSSGLHGLISSNADLESQSKQQQQRQQGNYVKLEPNSPAGGAADSAQAAMRPPFANAGSAVNGGQNDETPYSGAELALLGRSPPKRARVETVADWRAQQMT